METSVALLNLRGRCERIVMPPRCPSTSCQAARDQAVLEDLVARGVIDR